MKKIFYLLLSLFYSINFAISADMSFAQIEGALISTKDEVSINQLKNVIKKINEQKNIEFVVFTGNNIAKPSRENLDKFLEITKNLKAPYYITLGNKDVSKQKKLGKTKYIAILQKKVKKHRKINSTNYIFIKNNIVFIVLEGTKDVIPSSGGYYRPESLSWLDEQLNLHKNKKVIIFQHFPIIPPSKKEAHYTYKAEEYLKILSKHNNIKAIISGHFGTNSQIENNGIWHISTQNLPKYRVIDILDYETENPVFWSTIRE